MSTMRRKIVIKVPSQVRDLETPAGLCRIAETQGDPEKKIRQTRRLYQVQVDMLPKRRARRRLTQKKEDQEVSGERRQTERGRKAGGRDHSRPGSRATGNTQPNGPEDIIVAEMMKEMHIESIYEIAEWFQRWLLEESTLRACGRL